MRHIVALWVVIWISLFMAGSSVAIAGMIGVGDQLSLSITNKYGDVLANPRVAQILGDGLILQRGTMEMKVKYQDLPPDISRKYQAMAAGIMKKEENAGAVNAAYFAYTQQLQSEDARHLAAQTAQENVLAKERPAGQAKQVARCIGIVVPNQNWKLTIFDLGFSDWRKQESNGAIALHAMPGRNGFSLGIIIEPPANNLPGNDAVYNYFWMNMEHNSLIDAQSVKVEKLARFIKVSYTAQGQPNVNYFFAYHGHWVDLHLAKPIVEPGDDQLLADFDKNLSYNESTQ